MAKKVPSSYNYKEEALDPIEKKIRDELIINIENWAKFRHTIDVGVNSNSLKSDLPISNDVKNCYLELGKSHYEVVTMLGATKISIDYATLSENQNHLVFKKSFKEFYLHAGAVLDNLARIIYIINIPNAPTAKGDYGKLKRHSLGYGSLKSVYKKNRKDLKGYSRIINSKVINEIKTIRNNFTHSWPPVIFKTQANSKLYWPTAMRKKEQYYLWPHDPEEAKKIKRLYRNCKHILDMIQDDWNKLEEFQNTVFKKVTKDITKFEINHNLAIS